MNRYVHRRDARLGLGAADFAAAEDYPGLDVELKALDKVLAHADIGETVDATTAASHGGAAVRARRVARLSELGRARQRAAKVAELAERAGATEAADRLRLRRDEAAVREEDLAAKLQATPPSTRSCGDTCAVRPAPRPLTPSSSSVLRLPGALRVGLGTL